MVELHAFLTSTLGGGQRPALRSGHFIQPYPTVRRLGGPQSRSGCSGEGTKSLPLAGMELLSSTSQPNHYTHRAITNGY
jgi:hypothetical protein